MKRKAFALLLAALLLPAVPAAAAGAGITVAVQDGYQCDYGVNIPFTPSSRTSSYTFALYEGGSASGTPEMSAKVSVPSAGTVHLPLRYDAGGPSTWTLKVTAHVLPGREAFDKEASATETFTTAPVCGCPAGTAGAFYAGDGSAASPYRVATPEQLQHLSHTRHLTTRQHFRQTADLDLSSFGNWTPIGSTAVFTGSYDGGGYLIKNVSQSSSRFGGLFGQVVGAELLCIGMVNPATSGGEAGGGIVSHAYDSRLERCFVQGGSAAGFYHGGGLVGYAERCELQDCYVADTTVSATGPETNPNDVAGLIGRTAYSGAINGCFALPASLSTTSGYFEQMPCLLAGLVGCMEPSTTFTSSYWATGRGAPYACDRQLNATTGIGGNAYNPSGTRGMSAGDFASASNFAGFDFTGVWRMDQALGHPVLRAFDH